MAAATPAGPPAPATCLGVKWDRHRCVRLVALDPPVVITRGETRPVARGPPCTRRDPVFGRVVGGCSDGSVDGITTAEIRQEPPKGPTSYTGGSIRRRCSPPSRLNRLISRSSALLTFLFIRYAKA
ncbi:hypothetical protein PDE_06302 [Penicillium oxalicum 114-2]|uniref:Uncharacterized protein n=1 Tax=Penicillium oxalicum (strain 114-2 / CGMCC 5302) TaxID=933388 RepID=S8B9B4_PENO1|nr:hypothetical protein PDE_06302 [Penicillium oxalicum 114-2]